MSRSIQVTITDSSLAKLKVAVGLTIDQVEEAALKEMAVKFYKSLVPFLPNPEKGVADDDLEVMIDDDVEEDEDEEEYESFWEEDDPDEEEQDWKYWK